MPLLPALLGLMQPGAELDALARDYLQIRLLGLPAALASYALIGWLLGAQNARAPLAMLLTANLLNVALDLWFVLGLGWGVAGAGLGLGVRRVERRTARPVAGAAPARRTPRPHRLAGAAPLAQLGGRCWR